MYQHPFIDRLAIEPGAPSGALDADPSRRITWLSVLLTLPLVVVGVRLADLQGRLQPSFLEIFFQTRTIEEELPARDGRILAADGAVLADDFATYDLLVHYRWLEQPADPQWLKRQAWSRLSRTERRRPALVAAEIEQVQAQRDQLWYDLSQLTSRSEDDLQAAARSIQSRVDQLWWMVNERRESRPRDSSGADDDEPMPSRSDRGTSIERLWNNFRDELMRPPVRTADDPLVIREQQEFHPLIANVSPEVAAEIEAHPRRYPGVKVAVQRRRVYPQHDLAAHILGARTAVTLDDDSDSAVSHGTSGLERQYDTLLRGQRGRKRTVLNRHGEIVRTEIVEPPRHGRDVVLTLDLQLQRRAEQLLDAALQRTPAAPPPNEESVDAAQSATAPPQGGCLVALDVHTGAVLVAAAAPRFDANWLIAPDPARWQAAVADPRKPFYPRVTQMALPPGSVYKVATAIALLESGACEPHASIHCQGYLDRPDQYRCLTYRHYGFGHGNVDLSDALCRSCNVYFFTGARRAGADALVEWATKLGIGQPTGIDLPGETGGHLPSPRRAGSVSDRIDGINGRWYPGDTLGLAIGQSTLTVTPLQMARLMAAIANDGALVTPHLVASGGPVTIDSTAAALEARPVFAHPEPVPIPGLSIETLAAIRSGLYRVVHDPHGTGYHSVRLPEVAIAGKTGTAEVGGGKPDHAWFAGYVPADHPRVAFAVVLEHGGSGGKVAGPVAREFVRGLVECGLIGTTNAVAGP